MSMQDTLAALKEASLNRRSFLKSAALTAGTVAGATVIGGGAVSALAQSTTDASGSGSGSTSASGITDVDILNFALNLEYLESEFYTYATFGWGIVAAGVIPSSAQTGPTTGGRLVPGMVGGNAISYFIAEIRRDEQHHVEFLRSALGSAAVPKPAIKLDALGFGFNNLSEFIKLARIFEDVGVTAYNGAAPLIQNKTYLGAAARILATEAEHAGAVRIKNVEFGDVTPQLDAEDVPPTPQTPFSVDPTYGLTFARTPQQVLALVRPFFPEGLNGNIK